MTTIGPAFTEAEFIKAVEDSVAEKGASFVYRGAVLDGDRKCLYNHGTIEQPKPGCLFGHALHKLGVLDKVIEGRGIGIELDERFGIQNAALHSAGIEAQREQDKGATWGEALATFKSELKNW